MGIDGVEGDSLVHRVVRDWHGAGLSDADHALCEYAARLTHSQSTMSPDDLDALRAHGFTDAGVHDATQVIGYFNYISRIADGLGVEVEDFIGEWGGVTA